MNKEIIIGYLICVYGLIGIILHKQITGMVLMATFPMWLLGYCVYHNYNPLRELLNLKKNS